jgi:hypothetical protein
MIDGGEIFNTLLKDFEEHGASAIGRLVKDNPVAFLKLCAAVIQEDIRINWQSVPLEGGDGKRGES